MNDTMSSTDDNSLEALNALDDISPIRSSPPKGTKEHRKETRYRASWGVAIAVEGHDLHEGKIKDISLHGTATILNGRNLKSGISVKLHICIPPLIGPGAPKILIVDGKTSYAIHDADDLRFRVGVTFVKFELASDRAFLEARLTNHHTQVQAG